MQGKRRASWAIAITTGRTRSLPTYGLGNPCTMFCGCDLVNAGTRHLPQPGEQFAVASARVHTASFVLSLASNTETTRVANSVRCRHRPQVRPYCFLSNRDLVRQVYVISFDFPSLQLKFYRNTLCDFDLREFFSNFERSRPQIRLQTWVSTCPKRPFPNVDSPCGRCVRGTTS